MNAKQWDAEKGHAQYMAHMLGELRFPRTKSGRRKLRLYAVGCCRRVWDLLPREQLRTAVELAERFADGEGDKVKLAAIENRVRPMNYDGYLPRLPIRAARAVGMAIAACGESAYNAALVMTALLPSPLADTTPKGDRMLCDLLRCVFGNPFKPPPMFDKKWRSETVTALANGIYIDHAFDRLPIMADALEEAGCDDPAMLTHLRATGPHCRGCWVLDLALGK
jgi:hypothetical protein